VLGYSTAIRRKVWKFTKKLKRGAGRVKQVIEHPPRKTEALTSSLSTSKKKKKTLKRELPGNLGYSPSEYKSKGNVINIPKRYLHAHIDYGNIHNR
jgi:predicted transcriptional regulator